MISRKENREIDAVYTYAQLKSTHHRPLYTKGTGYHCRFSLAHALTQLHAMPCKNPQPTPAAKLKKMLDTRHKNEDDNNNNNNNNQNATKS